MAVWATRNYSRLASGFRFDAEYYRPVYQALEEQLERAGDVPLRRFISYLTDGTHVTPAYVPAGIPFFSSGDVDEFILRSEAKKFISAAEHNRLRHCQPEAGDVLISKSGRIGTAAVVQSGVKRGDFNIYEGIALLRLREVEPCYIAAFLNSRFGQFQIKRELKGVAQPHLHLEDLRRLVIFVASDPDSSEVSELVRKGLSQDELSNKLFAEAEHQLDALLQLEIAQHERVPGYAVPASKAMSSHRLDAQHFRPATDALLTQITSRSHAVLRKIAKRNDRGIQPNYVVDGNVSVINSQHLGPCHLDYHRFAKTTEVEFTRHPEAQVQFGDVLIYTTGAFVGRTNVYLSELPAIASNHVNILRLNDGFDPAFVALTLNSEIGQFQTQKHIRGSAQAELYPNDIGKFVIPILPLEEQVEIGSLVRRSLSARLESKRLLQQAKGKVEALIEEAMNR